MENPLQADLANNGDFKLNVRIPKRVIHCSDGVVEEYSDDEVDNNENQLPAVDPKMLTWGPWILHYAVAGGAKAIEYCDFVGETVADFLGITTPKYQLELSEYERMEAAKKKLEEESAGWVNNNSENGTTLITLQPTVVPTIERSEIDDEGDGCL